MIVAGSTNAAATIATLSFGWHITTMQARVNVARRKMLAPLFSMNRPNIAQAMPQLPTATMMVATICGHPVVTTMAGWVTLRLPYGLPPYHLFPKGANFGCNGKPEFLIVAEGKK